MGKNYSGIEHLMSLPNKELGHVGSGIAIEEKPIGPNNFTSIEDFVHKKELNDYIEAAPSEPVVPAELQNIGVSAVSNPAFTEHAPILDTEPVTPTENQIHEKLQAQLEQNKNPNESRSWWARLMFRKSKQNSSDKQAA